MQNKFYTRRPKQGSSDANLCRNERRHQKSNNLATISDISSRDFLKVIRPINTIDIKYQSRALQVWQTSTLPATIMRCSVPEFLTHLVQLCPGDCFSMLPLLWFSNPFRAICSDINRNTTMLNGIRSQVPQYIQRPRTFYTPETKDR